MSLHKVVSLSRTQKTQQSRPPRGISPRAKDFGDRAETTSKELVRAHLVTYGILPRVAICCQSPAADMAMHVRFFTDKRGFRTKSPRRTEDLV